MRAATKSAAGRKIQLRVDQAETAPEPASELVAKQLLESLAARRRHIDPTTCERDYSQDELEFMQALEVYKRINRRMFPTCSEILEVLRALGYEKRDPS